MAKWMFDRQRQWKSREGMSYGLDVEPEAVLCEGQEPKGSMKEMKIAICVISLVAAMSASAQLTYNVSGGVGNNTGVFSFFDPQIPWTSGDIKLPDYTIITGTPLEVDLNLSQNVTLDSSGHYSWFFNYGGAGIAPENNLGSLYMVLTENTIPLTILTTKIGFDAGASGFSFNVTQFGTGSYDDQLKNLQFNGVEIFVSNSDSGGENLTDLQISLDAVVPEPSTVVAGAMLLLPFGSSAFRQLRKKLQAA